ncbi:MAG: FKBP-type peptidyl-prolyl cis-trans isomerase [Gemmatimonadota bacterium]
MADRAKSGDTVAVHYTGTLEDGTVFDSSRDGDPIEFELGSDDIIEGFNDAVEGMEVGQEQGVDIQPQDAYGQRRDEYVIQVQREELPDEVEPEVGQALGVQLANGQQATARITDVGGDEVTLDLNHPLAGRKLHFDIELVEIR